MDEKENEEKKKIEEIEKETESKAKKTINKTKKKKRSKAFTLIELLAVIIILGVLMIVAIPAVTEYISESRDNTYVTTVKNLVGGARNKVNEGKLEMYDEYSTYYLPYNIVSTEVDAKTPYGEFEEAYIVATYNGEGYDYYFTGYDKSHKGIYLTYSDNLTTDRLITGVESIDTDVAICGKENIVIFDKNGEVVEEKYAYDCTFARSNYTPDKTDKCEYKIVTDHGSFSLDSDVKETCIETISDDYVYHYKDIDFVDQYDTSIPYVPTEVMSYFYLYNGVSYFKPDTYIKIYEDNTKQNLIKTITINDFNYKYRFSLSDLNYTNHYEYDHIVVPLGVYNYKNIYVEFSSDFPHNKPVNCTYEYYNNNDYHRCDGNYSWTIMHDTYDKKAVVIENDLEGPWTKNPYSSRPLQILAETLGQEAESMGSNKEYRITATKEGKTINFHVEFYTVYVY